MQSATCPACGKAAFEPVSGEKFLGTYHLERCVGCGHMMTRPVPDWQELAGLYGAEYYGPEHRRFRGPFETATTLFRRRRARHIARGRPPGVVIDVGCGRGLLLDELRRIGWKVTGTELSDEAAEYARDVLGIPVMIGEFHRLEIAPASVDLVILWQTFEHMREPNAVLQRVHDVLRPGGWAVVSVPNRDSWQARFTGMRWHHLDVPYHLHHYSASSLQRMLERHGLRVRAAAHFNGEQNPFGWLQSLLNMATPSAASGLFEWLRSSRGEGRALPLATLSLLPILAPMSFVLSGLEALARRGGTVTLWAMK